MSWSSLPGIWQWKDENWVVSVNIFAVGLFIYHEILLSKAWKSFTYGRTGSRRGSSSFSWLPWDAKVISSESESLKKMTIDWLVSLHLLSDSPFPMKFVVKSNEVHTYGRLGRCSAASSLSPWDTKVIPLESEALKQMTIDLLVSLHLLSDSPFAMKFVVKWQGWHFPWGCHDNRFPPQLPTGQETQSTCPVHRPWFLACAQLHSVQVLYVPCQ